MKSRIWLGTGILAVIVGGAAMGVMPVPMAGVYVALSLATYCMYFVDKAAARRGARRTPENFLHLASLLGGWPGALVAQQWLRHKTAKTEFLRVFWITIVINIAIAGWLVWSETATQWLDAVARWR